MSRNPTDTRERILDAAQHLILARGYAGASIDDILSTTELTKGAFFHHFRSKRDLAHSLIARYAERDADLMQELLARAERLSRDPLQQVLILLGLYEEIMDDLTAAFPGCLFASYAYQAGLFDERTNQVVRDAMTHWSDVVSEKLREVMSQRKTLLPVSAQDLADGAQAIFEGAFIMSMTLRDRSIIARQIRLYRSFIEMLFGAWIPGTETPATAGT